MKMKKISLFAMSVLVIGLSISASAQNNMTVNTIEVVGNKTSTVEGSLKDGVKLKSLDWAWMSSNACFPATQGTKFTGNHVLYVAELPPALDYDRDLETEKQRHEFEPLRLSNRR